MHCIHDTDSGLEAFNRKDGKEGIFQGYSYLHLAGRGPAGPQGRKFHRILLPASCGWCPQDAAKSVPGILLPCGIAGPPRDAGNNLMGIVIPCGIAALPARCCQECPRNLPSLRSCGPPARCCKESSRNLPSLRSRGSPPQDGAKSRLGIFLPCGLAGTPARWCKESPRNLPSLRSCCHLTPTTREVQTRILSIL